MIKFAVQILFYNCDQFILRTIANCAAHVDCIFILYSPQPWNAYNRKARSSFPNKSNPELLKRSPHFEKIQILEGIWNTEEEQREHCRQVAKEQGYDYLIVQDADEFYSPESYQDNLRVMREHPDYEVYQTPWINFWKNTKYALVHRSHQGVKKTILSTCPLFAINLKKPVRFESRRVPRASGSVYQLPGVCLHLSYVFSDVDMFSKINTWGHSHQVNKNWFKWKWLAWHPGKRYLNPISSAEWVSAVPYTGTLPSELADFLNPTHVSISLTWYDRLLEFGADMFSLGSYQVKQWRSRMTSKK